MTENSLYKNQSNSLDDDKQMNYEGGSTSFMRFMNTTIRMLKNSDGRNKLCGFIQYISKFSAACIIYTVDTSEIKTNINNIELIYDRHTSIKRIEKSMSNGRKIFRFLKFIEDMKKFYSYLYDSSFDPTTILKAFTTLSACFYHFLDNLVWASNMGMINRVMTGELRWKTSKNFFSLIRTLIKLITNIINFKNCYYNSWMNNENEIKNENYEKILNETFKNRSKLRMITLNIIHSILKLITIFYSLKIEPLYTMLHPIIETLCGILYCIISLFKIFYKTNNNQKKMVKNIKGSADNTLFKSTNNLMGLNNINNNSNNNIRGCMKSSFELSLVERQPNNKLLDENYFDNYYIDFNKDYPLVPEMVLKANGAEFLKFIA